MKAARSHGGEDAAIESSAPRALDELIQRSQQARASDVHLQQESEGVQVSFRLDGVMTPVSRFPGELGGRIFGRIKFLAKLRTYQDSMPQDGRIDKADAGAESDIRVATYPTV